MPMKRRAPIRAEPRKPAPPAGPVRGEAQETMQLGWGQWAAKLTGSNVMIVSVLGFLAYFLTLLLLRTADAPVKAITEQSDAQTKEHHAISGSITEHRLMNEREHAALIRTQERIANSLDEQVFYLSKTERERANYKIEMPNSLARKLVERGELHDPDRRNHVLDQH